MRRVSCMFAVVFLLAGILAAQETRGTISGTVKDGQGAVVPGGTVIVTNTGTNVSSKLATNEVGYYEAPFLMPGPYTISVEASGFKKANRSGVTLQVSDRRTVDFVLEIGAVTETVSVTAEAPLVDVSRTDSGSVLDERTVRDLPVMANTVFSMIRYAAGVQSGGPSMLFGPHSTQAGSDYNLGSGVGGNTWTIDGAVNDGNQRYTAGLPAVDAVAETKVLTTTFEGSFGHSIGMGVAVMTKTGTNDFHGTASDTYWSQRWQGSSFFAKQTYYKKIASLNAQGKTAEAQAAADKPIQPSGHSNMWTLNVTGPVLIPKVFNGRNRVFFTFSYNGQNDQKPEEPTTYNKVVPTALNKQGDFSDLLNVAVNPGQFQLYDPYSIQADPKRPGHYVRTPLTGNKLPGNYIATGKKFYDNYAKLWPDPNNWFDKSAAPTTNPYLAVDAPYNWLFDQYSGRMDVNLGKSRFFGRYSQNHFVEYRGDWAVSVAPGMNNNTGNGTGVTRDDQNGVLDWVYTVTPSTIAHAAFSVSNWSSAASVPDNIFNFKPSDVGLPTYLDQRCPGRCYMPLMTINGYARNGLDGLPAPTYNRFLSYNADLYHNRSNHSLRFGLDARAQTKSSHAGNNVGNYTFGNNYFRKYDDSGPNADPYNNVADVGLAWASFMMGMPTSMTISNNDSNIVSNPYYAGFAQDTWRVTPKLTLTLSLRMEYELGATERHNRFIIDYDANARLPISDAVEAAYAAKAQPELAASNFKVTGGAIYAGSPGARKRAWDNSLMWLPRIGFGYQVDAKTVVRGGYGIYYDTTNVNAMNYGPNMNYFSKSTNPTIYTNDANKIPVFNSLYSADGKFPTVSPLNNPFPVRADGTRFDSPLRDALGAMTTVGSGWTYNGSNFHARQQRWRVGVERQLASHDVVEVSYEGTYTSNMTYNRSNSLGVPSTYYNFSQKRDNTTSNYLNGTLPNPYYGINTSGAVPSNANAIYPDSVRNNATLWTWMSTNSLFTSPNRSRNQLLFSDPNGNVSTPEPRFSSRTQSIVVNYTHRFSRGLSANFGYTWMRRMSAQGYLQGWNPDDPTMPQVPEWRYGGNPHRVTATWVYDLPFGRGRAWLQGRIPSAIAGGWTVAGTYQYQPGGLIDFGNIYYFGDPNNIKSGDQTLDRYFNTAGCVASKDAAKPGDTVILPDADDQTCKSGFEKRSAYAAGSYQYRTFPRYIDGLRNPGSSQWDASLSREFKIKEIGSTPMVFQARVDMLNVMNRSHMGGVNTSATGSEFGRITAQSGAPNRFLQVQGRLRW